LEKSRKLLPIMKKPGLRGKKLISVWTNYTSTNNCIEGLYRTKLRVF
jgi:hypothetical protein